MSWVTTEKSQEILRLKAKEVHINNLSDFSYQKVLGWWKNCKHHHTKKIHCRGSWRRSTVNEIAYLDKLWFASPFACGVISAELLHSCIEVWLSCSSCKFWCTHEEFKTYYGGSHCRHKILRSLMQVNGKVKWSTWAASLSASSRTKAVACSMCWSRTLSSLVWVYNSWHLVVNLPTRCLSSAILVCCFFSSAISSSTCCCFATCSSFWVNSFTCSQSDVGTIPWEIVVQDIDILATSPKKRKIIDC